MWQVESTAVLFCQWSHHLYKCWRRMTAKQQAAQLEVRRTARGLAGEVATPAAVETAQQGNRGMTNDNVWATSTSTRRRQHGQGSGGGGPATSNSGAALSARPLSHCPPGLPRRTRYPAVPRGRRRWQWRPLAGELGWWGCRLAPLLTATGVAASRALRNLPKLFRCQTMACILDHAWCDAQLLDGTVCRAYRCAAHH